MTSKLSELTVDEIKTLAQDFNFKLIHTEKIPELNMMASNMVHCKSGANYFHLFSPDENNSFCVTFKTPAFDSSGLQHVLEHMSLCGSLKYRCRDPFFKMLPRSVSTFMNAMTYPEHTSYPFTTSNENDFFNLADVYTDAVFNPLLTQNDFCQEGWRLEHSNLEDKASDIIFKGVVFNEMKGVYSSNDSLITYSFIKSILPVSYPHENGGNPLKIPDLSYDSLKKYHSTYYHPSNSCFVTYGNIELKKHLDFLSKVLSKYDRLSIPSKIPDEPNWDSPRKVVEYVPSDPFVPEPEKQACFTVGFKVKTMDLYEQFILSIISSLLIDGPNSIFYPVLIEPNIGLDYSPVSGYNPETKFPTLSVGLKGISANDVEMVERLIDETLLSVSKTGFQDENIVNLISNMELSLKHITTKRGLHVSLDASSLWSHDAKVIEGLRSQHILNRFKNDYAKNPSILLEIFKREVLENKHRLNHLILPDEQFNEKFKASLSKKLEEKISTLKSEEKDKIFDFGLKLKEYQDSNKTAFIEDLPKIHLSDMPTVQKKYEHSRFVANNVPIQFSAQPTNGLTYFKAIIKTNTVPYISKSYIPFFARVLTKIGAGEMDYKQFNSKKKRFVRGMSVSPMITSNHSSCDYEEGLLFSSYCLNENIDQMFSLWASVFNSPHLQDESRLLTLLLSMVESLTSEISDCGHKYAIDAASARITYGGQISEKYYGVSQVSFIKQLAESRDMTSIVEHLKSIACTVLDTSSMRCSINTTEDNIENAATLTSEFLSSIPCLHEQMPPNIDFSKKSYKKFIVMPFDVNFVGKALPGVPINHADFVPLSILSSILSLKYLHPEIREKGGAYGSGVKLSDHCLKFFSYRDPNYQRTIQVFADSLKWIKNTGFTDEDIDEAKVKMLSRLDAPLSPSEIGKSQFIQGITYEMQQNIRDIVFKVSKKDLIDAAEMYLVSDIESIAVIGPDSSAVEKDDSWNSIEKIAIDIE